MKKATKPAGGAKLSRELRRFVVQLYGELPAQAERMIEAERGAIKDYAAIHNGELTQDVYDTTLAHAKIWYESLLAGRPPTAAELEPFAEVGRRRLRQGFDLPSLLHAIRLASIELWSALIAKTRQSRSVRTELLFQVSPYLLLHFDLISQAVTRGYTEEGQQRARWREQLKHELSDLLFSKPDELIRFRELARALDLDAMAAHAALAIRLPDNHLSAERDRPTDMDGLIERVVLALGANQSTTVNSFRHGLLLLWLPATPGESLIVQEQQLAGAAAALFKGGLPLTAVGVGLPGVGPGGWRDSADQALQALEIGRSLSLANAVLRYTELALDDAVRTSPGLGRYLESLLERLAAEPALLDTLDAFFNHRQHRKACAAALGIHINTLAYRLERIESLLGAQLDNTSWLARLHAALRLRPAKPRQ